MTTLLTHNRPWGPTTRSWARHQTPQSHMLPLRTGRLNSRSPDTHHLRQFSTSSSRSSMTFVIVIARAICLRRSTISCSPSVMAMDRVGGRTWDLRYEDTGNPIEAPRIGPHRGGLAHVFPHLALGSFAATRLSCQTCEYSQAARWPPCASFLASVGPRHPPTPCMRVAIVGAGHHYRTAIGSGSLKPHSKERWPPRTRPTHLR